MSGLFPGIFLIMIPQRRGASMQWLVFAAAVLLQVGFYYVGQGGQDNV